MKNMFLASMVSAMILGSSFLCWAADPSVLLKDQALMTKIIDDILKDNLKGGAFSAIIQGHTYIDFTPQKPEQKPVFEFVAWMYYMNAHRILSAVHDNQNIDEDMKQTVGAYIELLSEQIYGVGENRFGWNAEQTTKIYDQCLALINARIKYLEETALNGTAASNNASQSAGKALPFRESPGVTAKIVESCAMTMMMQKPESPKTQREMLDQCLTQSGYSYTATLQSLAENGFGLQDIQNILFLVMPAGSAKQNGIELSKVYSEEEIRYLQAIKERGKLDMY